MNLDQFANLERIGSTMYVGFNDGIEKLVFASTRARSRGDTTYIPALIRRLKVGFSSTLTTRLPSASMQPNGTVWR